MAERDHSAQTLDLDAALWARIERYEFDEGDPALTFARRLKRENGWSLSYTQRALLEYKRFAYLAIASGHIVTPSPAVDQVWHLHLTYTRSYWQRFCRDILGAPLHHEPTAGGDDEAGKHYSQYQQTLESYQRHFGMRPPADIWPEVEFTESNERWVDRSRYWLIPKPRRWSRDVSLVTAVALPVVALSNPFNWDGPKFLTFYMIVLAASIVFSLVIRWMLSDGSSTESPNDLDLYESAYLVHGGAGVIQAVLAQLIRRGDLALEHGAISRGTPLGRDASKYERVVVGVIPKSKSCDLGGKIKEIGKRLKPEIDDLRDRLRVQGLISPHPNESSIRRWVPSVMLLAVALIGLIKIGVGIGRDKPVMYLVLLTIVAMIAAIAFGWKSRLTRQGREVVEELKSRHDILNNGRVDDMTPIETAMLVGVFGTTMLAGTDLAYLHQHKKEIGDASGHGSGCGGYVGWGGGGCGGGDGGGGCGGGGCGGCGS